VRVLIADRALLNGYTLGLAIGLRSNGIETWIGGPAKWRDANVTSLYPRGDLSGQRLLKAGDAVAGSARFNRTMLRRPDLLHLQWPTGLDATYALAAKYVYRVPVAYTVHNFGRATDGTRYEAIQRRFIVLADLVLTHGPSMRQAIVEAYPWVADKTHVVELGNYEHVIRRFPRARARLRLGLPVDGPLYVFVGQLRPRKGLDLLLAAFRDHCARGGKGHLLIAGTCAVPGYERRLREIGGDNNASLHWRVSGSAVEQMTLDLAVSAANQVILPFHAASQSASLIMAMTHGRCVVSTSTGEVGRTLAGRGVVIDPGDRNGLLDALDLGEREPSYCDDLGALARRYALAELAWPQIAARTARLYDTIKRAHPCTPSR
jgi:beta-1,4-mannosyltransferase